VTKESGSAEKEEASEEPKTRNCGLARGRGPGGSQALKAQGPDPKAHELYVTIVTVRAKSPDA
jgi:hypothetical protein